MLMPFILMVNVALAAPADTRAGTMTFGVPTFENFAKAWASVDWIRFYINSLIVVLVTAALQIVISVPAAYVMARQRFAGRNAALGLVLLSVVLPISVTALPIFFAFSRSGLLDTFASLIVPYVGSGFCIFLVMQFIASLPSSMFDSARIDGAGPVAILVQIVVPNILPAIAAFSIFSIVLHWNDLYWPSVVLRTDSVATVSFKIAQFAAVESPFSYNVQMAGALLAMIPLLLLYFLMQRHLVRGLALSSGNTGE